MEVNVMNNGYNGYYGQDMYYGNPYMQNPYFQSQPMQFNQSIQVPQNQNALTNEEIQRLRSARPNGNLNLSIDPEDVLRSICTHKDNGKDVVQIVQDGSNDVWCPICGQRWSPEQLTQEDVQALVDRLVAQMENVKWAAELPLAIVREYFAMEPLLKKFPEIYKYGMKNFNKYMNQNGMYSAADANIYAMYNGLFNGGGYGYGNPYQQYQQQQMNYYQQVGQAQQAVGQQANPAVNPMQQPMYGAPGFNSQFANQANMMMGGTYYQQPMMQQPGMNMNPYMNQPQMGQPQQPMYNPVFNNTQTQQQATTQQTTDQAQKPAQDVKTDL